MSTTKVRRVSKTLDYTATWAADVLTVTTSTVHRLVTGDKIDLFSQNSPQDAIQLTVTVTNTTVFTVPMVGNSFSFLVGKVVLGFFRTGDTGRTIVSAPRPTGASAVTQSWVTGTGTAVYVLEGSLNGINWNTIATITHTATSGDTQKTTITDSWAYLAINITSVGAATKLEVLYSA